MHNIQSLIRVQSIPRKPEMPLPMLKNTQFRNIASARADRIAARGNI